jgi:predicted GIY-YIG superfamily endonuclease
MPVKYYVYGLRLKGTAEWRYIGCTTNKDSRELAHRSYDRKNPSKWKWMREHGQAVEMIILSTFDDEYEAATEEARLIRYYRAEGYKLFNKRVGGSNARPMLEETKAKLSRPKKRRMTTAQRGNALKDWFDKLG